MSAARIFERFKAAKARLAEEALLDFKAPSQCGFCQKEKYNMLACGKCKVTFFCSKECQSQESYRHAKECKRIKDNRYRDALKMFKV